MLPQDDIPFPFNGRRVELGILEDVTNDVNSFGYILLEALGVIDSLLPRCVGVKVSTHVFNLKLQSVLGATAGTLKSHMLEEVGGSVCGISLGPGASIYPDTDGGGLSVRVRFRSYRETI